MKEFVEKLIGRLEENSFDMSLENPDCKAVWTDKAIEIVNQLAEEYNNGSINCWISVKDRLPTEEGSYLVVGKTGGATVTRWYAPSQFHPQGHFGGNSSEYIRYWMPRPQAPTQNHCSTKQTNSDRIRSMSDEELAKFIRAVECCSLYSADCGFPFCPSMEGNLCNGIKEKTEQYILDWLQSEVKGSGI